MNNGDKKSSYIFIVIAVIGAVALSWQFFISPVRSEKSDLENQLVAGASTQSGQIETPTLEANPATESSSLKALKPLTPSQLSKKIRENADKTNSQITQLKKIPGGYIATINGSLASVTGFFSYLTAGVIALPSGQLTASTSLIKVQQLNIEGYETQYQAVAKIIGI